MDTFTQTPVSATQLLELYPRLGIPHFQRGLVWNDDATALLLESLYFGTPCGNIILWQPLEPEIHGQPMRGQAGCELLLVDGQQRTRMLFDARQGSGVQDGKAWCLDLTVEPRCSAMLPEAARRSLFIFAQHPKTTKNARYKYNLVPLAELAGEPISVLRTRYEIKGKPGVPDGDIDAALAEVADVVREMWGRQLFNVIQLQERGREQAHEQSYGIDYIVSLYNRINSAGRRVEPQEIAYATLVRIYPGTNIRLKEFFQKVHPQKEADRDTLLHREKERNFGFKLYLRTLVQVCNYHFGRSQGTQAFSFDILESTELHRWMIQNRERAGVFFERTLNILGCVRDVLRDSLCCDDLRMLPDIDCLIPAFQLLIRYPRLAGVEYRPIIAYLIFRAVIDPDRTQETTMDLVQRIERTHDAGSCIRNLRTHLGVWSEHKKIRLRNALESANTSNDRYVLLLYWLARRVGARDFSYSNLPDEKPLSRRVGAESPLSSGISPEKQHIAPAATLSRGIYGCDARITTSRHPINNIGNLTYISMELNHFESGLGDQWIDPAKESDPSDLVGHFLHDDALRLYEELRSREKSFSRSKADKELFEQFCKVRRGLIQDGFESWLDELQRCFVSGEERIVPEAKLVVPDTADKIRVLDYPNRIEDALLKLAAHQVLKPLSPAAKKSKAGDMVFLLKDLASKTKVHVHMFAATPRIEIEHRDNHGALAALESIMERAGVVRQADGARPWVMPCGTGDEETTGRILEGYVALSEQQPVASSG